MYNLNKISAENFISWDKLEFEIKQNIVTLIQGKNNDDDGQDSNGSGKSAFMEIISYLILGQPLKKVRDVNLINKFTDIDDAKLEGWLSNSLNNNTLYIKRNIYKKTSAKVYVELNGIDQSDKYPGVTEANQFILKEIGISKEDLINYYIISKSRRKSFYYSSDTEKQGIVGRFSGAEKLKTLSKEIEGDCGKIAKEMENLLGEGIGLANRKEVYEEEIEKIKHTDFEQLRKDRIEKCESDIRGCERDINPTNEKIKKHEKDLKEQEDKYKNIEDPIKLSKKSEDLEIKLSDIIKKKQEINESIGSLEDVINQCKKLILGTITCPKCNHEWFIGKESVNIEEIKIKVKEFENDLEIEKGKLDELNKKQSQFQNQILPIQEEINKINKEKRYIDGEITLIANDLRRQRKHLKYLEQQIENYNKQIKLIQEEKYIYRTDEFKIKLKDIEEKQQEIDKEFHKKDLEKNKLTEWVFTFPKFIRHLNNKTLKYIEGYTNRNLEKQGSNLSIEVEGFKELANGDIREEIEIHTYKDGFYFGPFDMCSEGEKARIDLSTIEALQQLINYSCDNGGFNFLGADEIVESVDKTGIENLTLSLNNLNKTMFIITHATHEAFYENIITIEKTNKKSVIV